MAAGDPYWLVSVAGHPAADTGVETAARAAITFGGVWALCGLALLGSLLNSPHTIEGRLGEQVVNEQPDLGESPEADWLAWGRSNLGQRYSPLGQITPDNVGQLEEAWRYQTGDTKQPDDTGETTYEATPLKVGNTLYLCTPITGWWP